MRATPPAVHQTLVSVTPPHRSRSIDTKVLWIVRRASAVMQGDAAWYVSAAATRSKMTASRLVMLALAVGTMAEDAAILEGLPGRLECRFQ